MWFWSGGLYREVPTALLKLVRFDLVLIKFVVFIGPVSINPVNPTDSTNEERVRGPR
jgi:hypothetical protein